MPVVVPFPEPEAEAVDVSDHAVVRWLERACGADIDKIRAEIREHCARSGLELFTNMAGDAAVYIDVPNFGVHLVVRAGVVCTVFQGGVEAADA